MNCIPSGNTLTRTRSNEVRFCAEPVREFAPPYKASDTEAAEQCFEPYSENRRFSEWVDPDGVAKKETGTH